MVFRNVFLVCLIGLSLVAQDPYGRVTGRVADSAGAVVPGARVRVTNVETNVVTSATTDSQGNYNVRNLVPGRYQLEVEMQGFKLYKRGPIEVRVGDALTIDVGLELGVVTDSVTVTAEAPLLEGSSASVGQVVDSRRVQDLPSPASSAIYMTQLSAGIIPTTSPTADWAPNGPEVASGLSSNGTATTSNEFVVDGVPNLKSYGVVQYEPMPEVVQEFRVQTAAYDASAGHYTGAQIIIVTKSGTNDLHGTLAYSYKGRELSTHPFFVNKRIYDLSTGPVTPEKINGAFPPSKLNRYRAVASGPVFIPKLYNGRNRTFWTFGHDLYLQNSVPGVTSKTVPTLAERNGDFSGLLALGSQYQIYDPATITVAPNGRTSRQPLAGNIVPAARIAPMAKTLMQYIPLPNASGSADGSGNYIGSPVDRTHQRNINARVDHTVNQNHRMFFTFTRAREDTPWQSGSGFQSDILANHYDEKDTFFTIDNVLTPRPDLVLDIRYGYMRNDIRDGRMSQGFDLAPLGFPASLVSKVDSSLTTLPSLSISGYDTVGTDTGSWNRTNFHYLTGSLSHTRGNHSLRSGVELRVNQRNNATYGYVSPGFSFGTSWTVGPLDNSPSAPIGQGFASYLLGLPTGGQIDRNVAPANQDRFVALYLQDDWKVSRKLTVGLGMRYELELPTMERYNRFNRGYDFSTANPIQDAARAKYAQSPIPQVPVASFQTIGGLLFAGVNGVPRTYWNTNTRNFLPRIGLTYQLSSKMVVRAGYGIFFETMGPDRYAPLQQGFNYRTSLTPSLDRGVTFRATLANPFPDGIVEPPGSSLGLKTFLGNSISFFYPDIRQGYVQRWSLNVQRELPSRVLVEVGYVGSRATRLAMGQSLDFTPRSYLSQLPVRDQATIDLLSAAVANPFYGMPEFAGSSLQGTTVSRSQLLLPYPQFTGLSTTFDSGFTWYNSMQARVEKRLTRGFTVLANYTWSKFMQATGKLNSSDPYPEHVISGTDRPQRLVMSGIYELPVGKGKQWLSSAPGWVNQVVGEWSVQAIYQGQSGPAIGFGNIILNGNLSSIVLPRSDRRVERWFNTDAGFEKSSARQLSSNIRTFPSRLTGLRADGYNNWDLSLLKNFRIAERLKFQLRAEAQDALNHAMFASPNTSPTSTLFGQVTSTVSGGQRAITVSGRLTW